MSLTDIMSAMRLSQYPSIALVIFLAAFAAVVLYALTKRTSEVQHEANMPLDDGVQQPAFGTHGRPTYSNDTTPSVAVGARKEISSAALPQGSER